LVRIGTKADLIELVDADTGVTGLQSIETSELNIKGKLVPQGSKAHARQRKMAQDMQMFEQVQQQDPEMKEHISSWGKAQAYEELLGFDGLNIIEQNIRISERAEHAAATQNASDILDDGEGAVRNARGETAETLEQEVRQ